MSDVQARVARPVASAMAMAPQYSPFILRVGYGFMLIIFILSTLWAQALGPISGEQRYSLDAQNRALVGTGHS
jgi:hypothetical protein